jgi:ACR3 family arsenite efflux pump ArsB
MKRGPSLLWLGVGAGLGVVLAVVFPGVAPFLAGVAWPLHFLVVVALALSLPLLSVGKVYQGRRVWGALLAINLLVVPLMAFVISRVVWYIPELHIGLLMVLLAPGVALSLPIIRNAGGDTESVLSATPLLLGAQLILVPLLTVWFSGGVFSFADMPATLPIIGLVIIVPVVVAAAIQWVATRGVPLAMSVQSRASETIVWWASGALAVTVWWRLPDVIDRVTELSWLVPLVIAFLVLIAPVSILVGSLAGVTPAKRRAIMIAGAGRGGLIILPITLALDPGVWALVPLVVVGQIVIEGAGLLVYRSIVPEIIDTPGR